MIKYFLFLIFAVMLAGCAIYPEGLLVTHITHPHTTDYNETPVGSKQCSLYSHKFEDPVSNYGVTVEWSANQINTEAQKAGINKIAYTDEQISSIFMGLYTHRKLIVSGN